MWDIKAKWRNFRQWQRSPYVQEAPSVADQHHCLNCGESFDGLFCPRCGQHFDTKRFTWNNAIRYLIEVWGLGNSVFQRTIFHLLTRPGYMIADYIKGRRQPYFQPVRLLFIAVTIFVITDYVLPHSSQSSHKTFIESYDENTTDNHAVSVKSGESSTDTGVKVTDRSTNDELRETIRPMMSRLDMAYEWLERNKAIQLVLYHTLIAVIVTRLFRTSPRLPRTNVVENFFAQMYICTQLLVISFVIMLLTFPVTTHEVKEIDGTLSVIVICLDYKQLFGYSWWGTLWRTVLSFVIYNAVLLTLIFLLVMFLALYAGIHAF